MKLKTRVLVVEDSVTQREIICRIVRSDDQMIVVGEARNGIEAVEQVKKLSPDVVLMDVHMDQMNGLDATKIIMRDNPTPVVIMSATLAERDVNLVVNALKVGAVAAIEKPRGAALLHMSKMAPELLNTVRQAAATPVRDKKGGATDSGNDKARTDTVSSRDSVGTTAQATSQDRLRFETASSPSHRMKVIGVASSAGGPAVLAQIFSALPDRFPIPVLLVQHISAGFESGFAKWLTEKTGQQTRIASADQKLLPGIWMGPHDHHIVLRTPYQIGLDAKQPHDIHCPAANPLLASIARHCGRSAIGLVLTGMGDDGAAGLLAMRNAGSQTIIQDEASAMVWGMPGAAQKCGASDHELSPAGIVDVLLAAGKCAQPR